MYKFFEIVNMVIDFMKQEIVIDGFVFTFWDIVKYMTIFGTTCWLVGKLMNPD